MPVVMEDFILDAIGQFLEGDCWLNPVKTFLEENKVPYLSSRQTEEENKSDTAYTFQQYEIYQRFVDLAENLLGGVIRDLGCDLDTLLKNVEEKLQEEIHGPRDEKLHGLLQTLLSFESFASFDHKMIELGCTEFTPTWQTDMDYSQCNETTNVQQDLWSSSEWILQEVIARSLLDGENSNILDDTERDLLPWARAVLEMKDLSQDAHCDPLREDGGAYEEQSETQKRLRELEFQLSRERLKVDLLVAQRISDSNEQLRKEMLGHSWEGDSGCILEGEEEGYETKDEEVERLIGRTEEIRLEIDQAKERCFLYGVDQATLEEIYLFLKEKIHYKQDLAQCQSEIYDYIFSRVNHLQGSDLVNHLLTWLLLESEGIDAQKRIHDLLFPSEASTYDEESSAAWTEYWDDSEQLYYYFNSTTNESSWEKPVRGYWNYEGGWVEGHSTESDTEHHYPLTSEEQILSNYPSSAAYEEEKRVELENLGDALDAALNLGGSTDTLEMETELQRIAQEHAQEQKRLEVTFQIERARQKAELQKRKEKKRLEREKRRRKKEEKEKKKGQQQDESKEFSTESTASSRKEKQLSPREAKQISNAPPPPLQALKPLSLGPKVFPFEVTRLGKKIQEPAIMVPGRGKISLAALLSDADKSRWQANKASEKSVPSHVTDTANIERIHHPPPAALNSASLNFLAEKVVVANSAWN